MDSQETSIQHAGGNTGKKVKLKLKYKGGIRVVMVSETYSFAKLQQRLREDYKFDVFLDYEDTDGDRVMLSSQNDLNELLANEEGPVHVEVSVAREPEPSVPSPSPSTALALPSSPPIEASPSTAIAFHAQQEQHHHHQQQLLRSGFAKSSGVDPWHHDNGRDGSSTSSGKMLEKLAHSGHAHGSMARPSDPGGAVRGQGQPRVPRALGGAGPNPWRKGSDEDPVRWLCGDVIGEGAFGTVHMGLNLDTGELMAVKSISLDQGELTSADAKAFENEIAILRDNKHENIVRYFGSGLKGRKLSIFLEYMPGGSVRRLLDRFGVFEERITYLYAAQMMRGLEFLHSNGVAHRDIKAANCLVDQRGAIKLADFGMSKRMVGLAGSGSSGVQSVKGTPFWMAPEVLQVHNLRDGWMKADVWSLGATILEMATGNPPWASIGPLAAMFKISCTKDTPTIPDNVSEEAQELMRRCLHRDPEERPSVAELVAYSAVAKVVPQYDPVRRKPSFQFTAVPTAARTQAVHSGASQQQDEERNKSGSFTPNFVTEISSLTEGGGSSRSWKKSNSGQDGGARRAGQGTSAGAASPSAAGLSAARLSAAGLSTKSPVDLLKSSPTSSAAVSPMDLLTTKPPGTTWKQRMGLAAGGGVGGMRRYQVGFQGSNSPSWLRVGNRGSISPTVPGFSLAEEKESAGSSATTTTTTASDSEARQKTGKTGSQDDNGVGVVAGRAGNSYRCQDTATAAAAAGDSFGSSGRQMSKDATSFSSGGRSSGSSRRVAWGARIVDAGLRRDFSAVKGGGNAVAAMERRRNESGGDSRCQQERATYKQTASEEAEAVAEAEAQADRNSTTPVVTQEASDAGEDNQRPQTLEPSSTVPLSSLSSSCSHYPQSTSSSPRPSSSSSSSSLPPPAPTRAGETDALPGGGGDSSPKVAATSTARMKSAPSAPGINAGGGFDGGDHQFRVERKWPTDPLTSGRQARKGRWQRVPPVAVDPGARQELPIPPAATRPVSAGSGPTGREGVSTSPLPGRISQSGYLSSSPSYTRSTYDRSPLRGTPRCRHSSGGGDTGSGGSGSGGSGGSGSGGSSGVAGCRSGNSSVECSGALENGVGGVSVGSSSGAGGNGFEWDGCASYRLSDSAGSSGNETYSRMKHGVTARAAEWKRKIQARGREKEASQKVSSDCTSVGSGHSIASPGPDGYQGTGGEGSSACGGQDGVGDKVPEAIGRWKAQRVDPAPDEVVPTAELRRPQGIHQAGGGGGSSERRRSSGDHHPQQHEPQPCSRHAGRSTRMIGSPHAGRDGVNWGTRTAGRGSPITRVSAAAGRGREDPRGEIARSGGGTGGGGNDFATVDASTSSSGPRHSVTSPWGGSEVSSCSVDSSGATVDLRGGASQVLSSMDHSTLTSTKAASVTDSESGSANVAERSGGEGFVASDNAGVRVKGARAPRGTEEQDPKRGFFELLTTTPKTLEKKKPSKRASGSETRRSSRFVQRRSSSSVVTSGSLASTEACAAGGGEIDREGGDGAEGSVVDSSKSTEQSACTARFGDATLVSGVVGGVQHIEDEVIAAAKTASALRETKIGSPSCRLPKEPLAKMEENDSSAVVEEDEEAEGKRETNTREINADGGGGTAREQQQQLERMPLAGRDSAATSEDNAGSPPTPDGGADSTEDGPPVAGGILQRMVDRASASSGFTEMAEKKG